MSSKSRSGWDEVYHLPMCMGSCVAGEPVVMSVVATSCVVPMPAGSLGGMGKGAGWLVSNLWVGIPQVGPPGGGPHGGVAGRALTSGRESLRRTYAGRGGGAKGTRTYLLRTYGTVPDSAK